MLVLIEPLFFSLIPFFYSARLLITVWCLCLLVSVAERLGRGIVTDAITTPVVNTSAYFFKKTSDLIDFKVCLKFPHYAHRTLHVKVIIYFWSNICIYRIVLVFGTNNLLEWHLISSNIILIVLKC